MLFSRARGGPSIEDPSQREIKLHNATLKYLQPRGAQGISSSQRQTVNYRNKPHKFKDAYSDYEHYSIAAAVWVYHRSSILDRFFREDIGGLTYDVNIHKYPDSIKNTKSSNRIAEYVQYFLHALLEGKRGCNTQTREIYPDDSDSELVSLLVSMPTKLDKVNSGDTDWVSFRLNRYPSKFSYTDYYFMPLNDEYALSFEWTPNACLNQRRKKERKEVEVLNQKKIDLMKNSINLKFD